jgi:hypothetical protein
MTPRIAAVALALGLSACATIVQGSDQRVAFETQPPGATVNAEMQTCTTPCSLRLKRNHNVEARIAKPGYEPETVNIRYELHPWILGNIVFLPLALVGGVVDIVSGAGFQLYPPYVLVPLRGEPIEPGAAPAPDTDGDWKPIPRGEGG